MIDTDTRQLRRDGVTGEYFTGAGKIPCDHCGHQFICQAKPRISCAEFLPAIPFTDEAGMQKLFNTIRVGMAWTRRLYSGQVISLYSPKSKIIFGHGRVLHTAAGPIDDMLAQHAHANHLMLPESSEEAPSILHGWLKQNYGPRIINETTRITAIYILRERFTPPPPNFGGHEEDREVEGFAKSPGQYSGDC